MATQTALSTEEIARAVSSVQTATHDAVKVVGEMVGRVAAIERITQTIAAAAEQQTAATGEIARNVLGTAEAMRIVSSQVKSVSQEAQGTGAAVNEMRSVAGEVAEHISELRNVMVRIVRTSSDAANRREDERVSVNLPATLVLNGDPLPAICLDLSFGGARVQSDQPLTAGTAVILRLGGLPDLNGAILRDGQEASDPVPMGCRRGPAGARRMDPRKTRCLMRIVPVVLAILLGASTARAGDPASPDEVFSHDGVLSATLVAAEGKVHVGHLELDGANYNGVYAGPVLHVHPGDLMRLMLVNHLSQPTNLHFHGIQTSPLGNSDNPHLVIQPGRTLELRGKDPAHPTTGSILVSCPFTRPSRTSDHGRP